jgi:uncharacterized membrane protein
VPVPMGATSGTFSATDAITYGWNGFKANLGPLIVIALVIIAVNLVVSFLQQSFDSWLVSMVFNLLGLLISLLLTLGLIRAALIIVDGRHPKAEDVLRTDHLGSYILATILVWLIVTVGIILCIIPGIIAGFLLQFYGYAILDGKSDAPGGVPSSDPVGSLRTSFQITSQHVGELLLLLILVFVVNLVGILLCGVGLLVSMPVTAIAIAYAWRYFSKGPIAPQLG